MNESFFIFSVVMYTFSVALAYGLFRARPGTPTQLPHHRKICDDCYKRYRDGRAPLDDFYKAAAWPFFLIAAIGHVLGEIIWHDPSSEKQDGS
jgi:hypothetical protein